MKIIDISIPISRVMPIWPKSSPPRIIKISDMSKGDKVNETRIEMSVHTGTHIDAPLHFLSNGDAIDQSQLGVFFGQVFVAYLPKVKIISATDLSRMVLPKGITRILFRTSNSVLWKNKVSRFRRDYVGLTTDAAFWLVKRGVKLVGVDYLSVASFSEISEVHKILLKKNTAILEGLDLTGVKQGLYQLICLPINIFNVEAAPVRAVLIES